MKTADENLKIFTKNIEEVVERLEKSINDVWFSTTYSQEDEERDLQALLSDYKRVLKENEELKQSLIINKKLYEELCNKNNELKRENITLKRINHITEDVKIEDITEIMNKSYNEFIKQFIPKQKIKDKIEELRNGKDFDEDVYWEERAIDILQELLESEE